LSPQSFLWNSATSVSYPLKPIFIDKLKIDPMLKFYSLRHHYKVAMKTILFSTLSTFSIIQTKAQLGNALQYTGSGPNIVNGLQNKQFLTLGNNLVQGISSNFTIEGWVNWTGNDDVWERIFDFGTGTGNTMFFTTSGGGSPTVHVARFGFIVGSTVEVIDASTPFPKNVWTHFAITIDAAGTGKIYFNGTQVGSTTGMTLRPSSLGATNQNYLGKSQFLPDPYFNGIIDELRISNTVRYTSNFTPPTTEFSTDANTVALFHFNEGSGQTTADASGNGFSGTLGLTTAIEPDLDPEWLVSGSILPVRIETFTAQKQGNSVDLRWKAYSTGEGGEFEIQRSNGNEYESIGKMTINDNEGSFSYSFKDAAPVKGKNYYRIQILEKNAAPKISSIVWVDMNSKGSYSLNPTMASSEVFITVPGPARLFIFNTSGVLVQRVQLQASQNINVSSLSKGLYHIQVEGTSQILKFVKL